MRRQARCLPWFYVDSPRALAAQSQSPLGGVGAGTLMVAWRRVSANLVKDTQQPFEETELCSK